MRTLLRGGRVIDPATGFDGTADVLVSDGEVIAVGPGLPTADDQVDIDVAGYIVGPGFIDLHSHVHSIAGQRLQAMDGVTTALDLEAGMMPVERAYAEAAAAGRPLHYGFSASWGSARAKVLMRHRTGREHQHRTRRARQSGLAADLVEGRTGRLAVPCGG